MRKRCSGLSHTMVSVFGPASAEWYDADRASVVRVRSGDKAALADLWDRNWPWLWRFFCSKVGSREEAEDLASATLLCAFEQLDQFRGVSNLARENSQRRISNTRGSHCGSCTFRTYLRVIAQRKLSRCLKQKMRWRISTFSEICIALKDEAIEGVIHRPPDENPLLAILRQERRDEAIHALAYVGMKSNEQFGALLLHYGCGLPHIAVAELLSIRCDMVNARLQQGRRQMHHYYDAVSDETGGAPC